MKITETRLPGVLMIEPKVFGDARGFFLETFAVKRYEEAGIRGPFVQDNMSKSAKGIVRGLHLQSPAAQGKLVWVVAGAVLDVAVDVRVGSPTFGAHVAIELSEDDKRQLWIPPGFAHGFCVTSESAIFAYKCTEYYAPENEVGVAWNDPDLGIEWPVLEPVISGKDRAHPRLKDVDPAKLPRYEETGA
ncbi:MAG: dTDP-4-dehydrorhamnose 3,5-epimerase [Myxococcota bacterium]|nr:dTDP-4-dehydrorhamnose 3,5-epimerase [Myxococcota bacterium]